MLEPEWEVTHTADVPIWFYGNGKGLTDAEKGVAQKAIVGPFAKFVNGDREFGWGTKNHRDVRTLKSDGSVQIWKDDMWDEALRVWRALRAVDGVQSERARL